MLVGTKDAPEQDAGLVGWIRNLNTGFISLQFHVIYDPQFQTVTGGYEDNDTVANHIWQTLIKNESENVLIEAEKEQEPLPSLHKNWLTQEELTVREDRSINSEVMRRIQRRDLSDKLLESNTWAMEPSEVPDVTDASNSESEKEDKTFVDVPKLYY